MSGNHRTTIRVICNDCTEQVQGRRRGVGNSRYAWQVNLAGFAGAREPSTVFSRGLIR